MIAGEGVFIRVIKSENAYDALRAFQRHSERGAERGKLLRIIQIAGLDGRIAVQNRLALFSHPAAQPLAEGDFERREQAKIFTSHILRQ